MSATNCVFTLRTLCTYFLGVPLGCPCMLFWQLEAKTWHDNRGIKSPGQSANTRFKIIDTKELLDERSCWCNSNSPQICRPRVMRAEYFFHVWLGPRTGGTLTELLLSTLLLDFLLIRFWISSSSLKELFPYRSVHQARYWKEGRKSFIVVSYEEVTLISSYFFILIFSSRLFVTFWRSFF